MEDLAAFFYPLTIISTRYDEPARYVAYYAQSFEIDDGLNAGDTDMEQTRLEMQDHPGYTWAEGHTIEDAISNLFVASYLPSYRLQENINELRQFGTFTVAYYSHSITFNTHTLCEMLSKHLCYVKRRASEFSEAYCDKRIADLLEMGFSVECNDRDIVVTFDSTASETRLFDDNI